MSLKASLVNVSRLLIVLHLLTHRSETHILMLSKSRQVRLWGPVDVAGANNQEVVASNQTRLDFLACFARDNALDFDLIALSTPTSPRWAVSDVRSTPD